MIVLAHVLGAPAVQRLHAREFGNPPAQRRFHGVLRQSFVVREIERPDQLALQPVVAVVAQQRAVGRQAADPVFARNRARPTHGLFHAPEMKMLHGPLRQVLALGDRLRGAAALDHDAADAALAELNRQPHAHGSTAGDDDLRVFRSLAVRDAHAASPHLCRRHSGVMPASLTTLDQRG